MKMESLSSGFRLLTEQSRLIFLIAVGSGELDTESIAILQGFGLC